MSLNEIEDEKTGPEEEEKEEADHGRLRGVTSEEEKMEIDTTSNEGCLICGVCQKSFQGTKGLHGHMRVHSEWEREQEKTRRLLSRPEKSSRNKSRRWMAPGPRCHGGGGATKREELMMVRRAAAEEEELIVRRRTAAAKETAERMRRRRAAAEREKLIQRATLDLLMAMISFDEEDDDGHDEEQKQEEEGAGKGNEESQQQQQQQQQHQQQQQQHQQQQQQQQQQGLQVDQKNGRDERSADHGGGKAGIREHKCEICSRVFETGPQLGGHKRKHYNGAFPWRKAKEEPL